ncbi:bifunctional 2-polyprenyl-6-hydroxyphenol methylase/3-demethylubiquinol 3-O-methyltransferase UbiG, partial [Acidiphilium sp. PM]|uniref:class I SAM-dependent methyltransferase n=1 Tax=Acidiphilium sp. PM TaxID=1043206 RepID=UPI000681C474
MPDDIDTLYDRSFFDAQSFGSLRSAHAALSELLRHYQPQSVLDVGCGVGAWLRAAGDLGIPDRLGVDGDYVDRSALMVPESLFLSRDLAQPGLAKAVAAHRPPPGRFDLVMCLEVAEHLPFERSASLVDDICRLGDLVLFSAAIPFQHGTGHVNEQWPEFWAIHFRARGYACFDLLRTALWAHPDTDWWYAQNLLVFAREGSAAHDQMTAGAAAIRDHALALVHPKAWLSSILNQWHPHRAAARQEEQLDLCELLRAWAGGAHAPPVLRAVQRARNAPPEARDVFPFTRIDVDEPERLLAEAQHKSTT